MLGVNKILLFLTISPLIDAYDATRDPGQTGQDVVDASVGQVQDTCIFTNDRQFMRRLAYVESNFGSAASSNSLGGIWRLSETYFNKTLDYMNGNISQNIYRDLHINYTAISYDNNDMSVPLDNALATRFYLNITHDPIPWTIQDQASYYAQYYNTSSNSTQYFLNAVGDIPVVCSSPGADVLFMLDGSTSITSQNFQIMKNFLLNITESFPLGLDDYQIAVLVFSDNVVQNDYIAFNSYNWNLATLQKRISKLTQPKGNTRTDLALDFARETVFTPAGGVRPEDEGYPRVGIVITDGQSTKTSLTVTAAANDRAAGIVLFSVGIGSSVDNTELNNIASKPTCMHVYNLNDYAGLSQGFPEELKAQTCVAPAIIQPNQSVINNCVQDNQLMYFVFSVNASVGVTFQLSMSQGQAGLYLSTEYTHPTDVQYDFSISPSSGGSVYISPDSLTNSSQQQQSMLDFLGQNDPTDSEVPLFASIMGAAAGNNNFTLTIYQGYSSDSASALSTTSLLSILFLSFAYLLRVW